MLSGIWDPVSGIAFLEVLFNVIFQPDSFHDFLGHFTDRRYLIQAWFGGGVDAHLVQHT
jgi:phenylalanine-4-hydroxylase